MGDDANRYRREQDLIFQQIEELEFQERRALAAAQEALRDREMGERYKMLIRLSKAKAFQDLMAASTPDARVRIVETLIRAWEENRERTTTPESSGMAQK